jgi:hypothetical protein
MSSRGAGSEPVHFQLEQLMTRQIDSTALLELKRILDLQGPGGGAVMLDDEHVSLTLDILDIARRSLAPGIAGGWFWGIHLHVHSGTSSLSSTIDVYNTGEAAIGGWPVPIPEGFDVWVLGVGLNANTAANFTDAGLYFNLQGINAGWGINQSGSAVVPGDELIGLARWDALTAPGGGEPMGLDEQGNPYTKMNVRLPRGSTMRFNSTSTGAVNVRALVLTGLFPSGLGQDVVT